MDLKFLKSHTGAKVLSLLFALVLWFNVATDQEYGYKVEIPILYLEPSSGFMLASAPPRTSQIYLSGSGKSLFRYALLRLFNRDDSYVSVTLSGLSKGQHRINLSEQDVFIPLDDAVRVDDILSNSAFTVAIDRREKRTVPVAADSLPLLPLEDGLVLNGAPQVIPAYVIVDGPDDVVSNMASVRIAHLDEDRIALDDTLLTVPLASPSPFVAMNQETVELHLPVERLRTKLFRGIPVTYSGFPGQSAAMLSPDTLSVMIQGPESVISVSRAEDVAVEVDYRAYLSHRAAGDSLIAPAIRFPEGITSASTTPAMLSIAQSSL